MRIQRTKSKPVKAEVVDAKQERRRKLRWVLKWLVGVPLALYLLWWLFVNFTDAFDYLSR